MSNAGVVGNTGWQAVRNSADIQFAPIPPTPPPPPNHPPDWLIWLGQALEWLFAPLGRAVGLSWPIVEKLLLALALALAGAVLIAWQIMVMMRRRATAGDGMAAPEWRPAPAQASQLLVDADRLADEGRFAEAVHLLLRRSVDHIAAVRPDWLHPASTAREIAGLENLPTGARSAFAIIAQRVERSRFALRALDAADWQAARDAYARFALQALDGGQVTA